MHLLLGMDMSIVYVVFAAQEVGNVQRRKSPLRAQEERKEARKGRAFTSKAAR